MPRQGIRFEGVTFRYPGQDAYVLDHLDLWLPAGAALAIAGTNGAGKTTLVKLLGRFYEPDAGRIFVDGVDLRRFDVEAWRARISGAFQDFCRFELLVREAVGVAALERLDRVPAVQGALVRAGADDFVAALPGGLETQLGKDWEGGVDLSGGQWQKLALGRAFMRADPLLVVFDEPTAALDAPTEHALFERFAAAARTGVSRGTVTLIVSHRFSTVRMADLIVVLDRGRVAEQGSHDELMARDGLYAELYGLQARAYR
jgi:ATP-binding cassette subfamily B protein